MHAAHALPLILVALGDLIALIWIRQWHRRQRMTKRMNTSLSAAVHREIAVKTGGHPVAAS
jgi:hypothetical protein